MTHIFLFNWRVTRSLCITLAIALSLLIILATGCQSAGTAGKNSDGVAYFGQAKYDKALLAFQESAREQNPSAFYNMGATYYYLGKNSAVAGNFDHAKQQFAASEAAYRQCLTLDANHAAAYRGLAVLWSEMGYSPQAFDLLIGWNQRAPASTDAKIELARLYQEYGKLNETQSLLQAVLAYEPSNARGLRAMGFLYDQSGQTYQAAESYRRSLTANPQQRDVQERLQAMQAPTIQPVIQQAATPYTPTTRYAQSASPAKPF